MQLGAQATRIHIQIHAQCTLHSQHAMIHKYKNINLNFNYAIKS